MKSEGSSNTEHTENPRNVVLNQVAPTLSKKLASIKEPTTRAVRKKHPVAQSKRAASSGKETGASHTRKTFDLQWVKKQLERVAHVTESWTGVTLSDADGLEIASGEQIGLGSVGSAFSLTLYGSDQKAALRLIHEFDIENELATYTKQKELFGDHAIDFFYLHVDDKHLIVMPLMEGTISSINITDKTKHTFVEEMNIIYERLLAGDDGMIGDFRPDNIFFTHEAGLLKLIVGDMNTDSTGLAMETEELLEHLSDRTGLDKHDLISIVGGDHYGGLRSNQVFAFRYGSGVDGFPMAFNTNRFEVTTEPSAPFRVPSLTGDSISWKIEDAL